jgi:hypothetical protein
MGGPEVQGPLFGDTVQVFKILSRWQIDASNPGLEPNDLLIIGNFTEM